MTSSALPSSEVRDERLASLARLAEADLFVVITKADRASANDLDEARRFTAKVIGKMLPGRSVPMCTVSAQEVLAAGRPPNQDWNRLETALSELALAAGATLVEAARLRESTALGAALGRHIDEAHGALLRPIAETEQRIAQLQAAADEAERALVELHYLFDAEQKQIERWLDASSAAFVAAPIPDLVGALPAQAERTLVFAAAQDASERQIRAWREVLRPRVEREFAAAARRFATAAEQIAAPVRASSPEAQLPGSFDLDTSLRARSRFYFRPLNTEASLPWWARLADHLRSAGGRERAVRAAGERFLRRLLETNAHGVVGDYIDRIVEGRRGIERAVRHALRGSADAAIAASERAERLRKQGQAAIAAEVARLVTLRRQLDALVRA